jgi:tetratricopeptide (TPR) repeat protein
MKVRFARLAVVVGVLSIAAAGCGKYSISNIRSAKAFQDANKLYQKSDYQGAVTRYEDAIRFNPELGFAYFFLGHSYESLYKPSAPDAAQNRAYLQKAAEHYRTAITKLAGSENEKEQEIRRYAYEYLLLIYGPDKLNDFEKVEPIAREMINQDPGDPATYQMLAKLYMDQGRFEEAEAQYLKAIEVKPAEPVGYMILADFYNKQGEFEKTMEAWFKRAEVEPKNPEAWHTIGVYYQDKVFKDKRLARNVAMDYVLKGVEAEDKALALNPDYFEAVTYKNILLRQQAYYERDPAKQKALIQEADILFKKANDLRAKQMEGGGGK